MEKIYCIAAVMVSSLTIAGCRSSRQTERSSMALDSRMEYRSIARMATSQLDSALSKINFGADSITISLPAADDSIGGKRALKVTIHNPHAKYSRNAVTRTEISASVTDTVATAATVNSHREADNVSKGNGSNRGVIAGLIIGVLSMAFIFRMLTRRN